MTDQRVRRLLWRGEASWLIAILLGFIAIGVVAGFGSVQKVLVIIHSANMGTVQFFERNLQLPNNVGLRSEIFASHYFYFLAILTGLLSVFWGRRTHYFEFLFNIGVTRKQIFSAQLWFSSLVMIIGTLAAELAEYAIIQWQIPAADLKYFPYQILIGQAFAAVGVSLLLFGLGLLVGTLNDHFTFAVVLSLLIWRPFYDYLTDNGMEVIKVNHQDLWVVVWQHHYWSLLITLVAAVAVIGIARGFFVRWSAENSRRVILFPKLMLIYQILLAWSFGLLFSQLFLWIFSRNVLMTDIMGFVLFFAGSLIWQFYQQRQMRGGQQNVDY